MKVWVGAALIFFPLYTITASEPIDIIYAFDQFAFVLAVGVYWLSYYCFSLKHLNILAKLATTGLILGVFWVLWQYHYLGAGRTTSIIAGGANLIARIAPLLFFFALLPLIISAKSTRKWLLGIIATFAMLTIVVYSGSRGVILVVPFLIFFPALFLLPKSAVGSSKTKLLLVVVVSTIIAAGFYFDPNNLVSSAVARVGSILSGADMDSSTNARYLMWRSALNLFVDNPLFGIGRHSFTEAAPANSGPQLMNYFSFHADLANYAVAGGIIGVVLYVTFVSAPLLTVSRKQDPVRNYWAVSMFFTYMLLGLTDSVIGFDYPTMFIAFSFAIIWGVINRKLDRK